MRSGLEPVPIGIVVATSSFDVRMIETVGVDHVGIGTDMDGISPASFASFDDYAEWPSITASLLARGYSREDVAKVAGENFLRVYRDVAAR